MLFLTSCATIVPEMAPENHFSLIPLPASVVPGDGFFFLDAASSIGVSGEYVDVGEYLGDLLSRSTGFPFPVTHYPGKAQGNGLPGNTGDAIHLIYDPGFQFSGPEAYSLVVDQDGISIKAKDRAGLFYGCQTLVQLLPPEIVSAERIDRIQWKVPFVQIRDAPRFSWRGAMLDVARHFFSVRDVKRFIDLMAFHKLNRFHMHLSDDQGWRLEIKSWPRLALHGGSSAVGGGPGGYYTREEFKEIIRYAESRCITLVPEIDMPGHTNAALSSYPELNAGGTAPELYQGIKVGFSCFDIHNETVYTFIDDVVGELAALVPGPYIHIGGDEVKKAPQADYIYFIHRVQDIVQSHDKVMIGWEEISQADLESGSIVQYWKKLHHAKKAIAKGNKIIVSPAEKMYLDMKYKRDTPIGTTWAGCINVKQGYSWDPVLPGLGEENILGIEAPLWTETVLTIEDIEYLAFPRLAGYAEQAWSPGELLDWDHYKVRLSGHGSRLRLLGVNFYQSPFVIWEK